MTQTIELTSKKLKNQLLIAWAIIVISFIFVLSKVYFFTLTLIGGFIYLAVVKIKIWYQHK